MHLITVSRSFMHLSRVSNGAVQVHELLLHRQADELRFRRPCARVSCGAFISIDQLATWCWDFSHPNLSYTLHRIHLNVACNSSGRLPRRPQGNQCYLYIYFRQKWKQYLLPLHSSKNTKYTILKKPFYIVHSHIVPFDMLTIAQQRSISQPKNAGSWPYGSMINISKTPQKHPKSGAGRVPCDEEWRVMARY